MELVVNQTLYASFGVPGSGFGGLGRGFGGPGGGCRGFQIFDQTRSVWWS